MSNAFDFNDLFVFDMANNHQGSVEHGLKIIEGVGAAAKQHGVRGVLKFQFRQLDSFIHPAHKASSSNKHLGRFSSTRMDETGYKKLYNASKAQGMYTMCTPFDEESVDLIVKMGFDLIKVASCSAKDWPLLEKIANSNLPVIFSTGGLELSNIDDLVSFFEHRGCEFAIMHCVSLYPIPSDKFHLNQIDVLKERYPTRVIGWSTHEDPEAQMPIAIAVAKGARIFERHVGVATDKIALNTYSSTPAQVATWIASAKAAVEICGSRTRTIDQAETESLDSLRRGVFARKAIEKGKAVSRDMVYFAMPYLPGQMDSGHWRDGIVAQANVAVDQPILTDAVSIPADPDYQVIKEAVHEVKALLAEGRIALNSEFEVEYSHHYGIRRFREVGAVIINVINREYCKKILVQLPGQKHPAHFHKLKEETFQVLHGELRIAVDGREKVLLPGDTCMVLPGVWHSFWTPTGCVFEEVSTTHHNNDSIYKDSTINSMERHQRKTRVNHWGRWELSKKVGEARQ
jgi:N-acetylneuraminate synthase